MPFEAVTETLLKGGIAPRRVRRYVRELDEHLDDLTAQQRAAGYDGEDAASRARARLGGDSELAQAMLDQPGMRSWPARLPWLVFLLLPPVLTAVIGLALYATVFLIGYGAAKIHYGAPKIGTFQPLPESGLVGFAPAAMTAVQVLAAPAMAALLVLLADRQRLKAVWPLLGIVLLQLLTPLFVAQLGPHHSLQAGYGLVIPIRWSAMMRYWPVVLSHILAFLPALWLIRRLKRIALALLLMTLPSAAQDIEQVTVYGGSLSGFWRIEAQDGVLISLLGHVTWGPPRQVWCRRDHGADGYANHCFASTAKGGGLEQDGRHFHMVSGSTLMRLTIDGEVTSPTSIEGHYTVKLMGVPVTNPALAHSTKFVPRPDAPDEAGKAQVVRSVLNGDAVAYDAALDADIAAARGLKLGAIQSITFLGRQFMLGKDGPKTVPDLNYLAAYAVEFADGERLCWLHQDDDGKLAAFRCA